MATLEVRLADQLETPDVLAVPVRPADEDDEPAVLAVDAADLPDGVAEVCTPFLTDVKHSGGAGASHALPLPLGTVRKVLFVGVGDGEAGDWRAVGAAVTRGASGKETAAVVVPGDLAPDALAALTEGALLASYRFRLTEDDPDDDTPELRTVTVVVSDPQRYAEAHQRAVVHAEATNLARDLTNTPSVDKRPDQLADLIARTASEHGLRVTVRDPKALADEGFGGILAVGSGSSHGPRLVELAWEPPQATRHVVLVGKGITFDTGGISIKPRNGMLLMKKDMGGVASVVATAIGAARLKLPVRVTVLAPLAENLVGADSYRPGDVVRHYGGITTEVLNTDAEGRMVLADALAYATQELKPDVVVDLATLTGAAAVALGKRTAALFSDGDELAEQLTTAAERAGEKVWRLPLPEDYVRLLESDVADLNNAPGMTEGAGSITAALFLREFVGSYADRWAHIDMSNVSWADSADAELAKYATGWGVRTLLHWLSAQN